MGWRAIVDVDDAVADLRALARTGRLATTAERADPQERRRLSGAAMAVASPVVFRQLTRKCEKRRGHPACAVAIDRLADDCLDRFYDDLEPVVADVLTHARTPIANVEGWITSRLRAVTVDAHRRRRGARGALQKPRLPLWLATGLDGDPWHEALAIRILVWVGVPSTAGASLWPLDSWAELRATITGDHVGSDARTVEREVELVLSRMRARPGWYADYVERPLGAKNAPVAPAFPDSGRIMVEPPPLALIEPHETDEGRLTLLASAAIDEIVRRMATERDLHAVVASVLRRVFGTVDLANEVASAPYAAASADEWVPALVTDGAELERIVAVVRDLLADVA